MVKESLDRTPYLPDEVKFPTFIEALLINVARLSFKTPFSDVLLTTISPAKLLNVPVFHIPLLPGLTTPPILIEAELLKVPPKLTIPFVVLRSINISPPVLLKKEDWLRMPTEPGLTLVPIFILPELLTVPLLFIA